MNAKFSARPNSPMVIPTPFHDRTEQANLRGHWTSWAGYTVTDEYTNTELEYFAVRNQCGIFDMSPMIKYHISGVDAQIYLNRLFTRNVEKINASQVAYVLFCNEKGYTLDDGTLFKFSDTEFMFCTQDRHLPWLNDSAIGFDVEIKDRTEKIAALAVQGPTSAAVLKKIGFEGIENLPPFQMKSFPYHRDDLIISRTGFTGDLGYELWVDPFHAIKLWDDLFAEGGDLGVVPFGNKALDLLRIEAGFVLPPVDFLPANHVIRLNRGRSPIELGFERLVDFDKGFFNGRQALLEEKKTGSRYKLVGLEIDGNKPATDAWIYHNKRKKVGTITSAIWSPTCKSNIALAWLDAKAKTDNLWADIYTSKELKWHRDMMACKVVRRPFFNPPRRYAVPAANY